PETSRARELAARFNLPCVECDINAFYRANGEERNTIRTERGRRIRDMWTDELRRRLKEYDLDFAIFAGFVTLCNIAEDFPCLNVHPGDLTYLKDGERYLVGLHAIPVERAILEGLDYLRSSMIVATPVSSDKDIDAGILLGISGELKLDVSEERLAAFRAMAAARPPVPRPAGWSDELRDFARECQEKMKLACDYPVLYNTLRDFASGRFLYDAESSQLYYRMGGGAPLPVRVMEYSEAGREIIFR
ncbi:MAG: hypothetical protein J6S21_05815, partial [Victivallales bacterium]|nr:hypothetical protein [Victivallales bacterium]